MVEGPKGLSAGATGRAHRRGGTSGTVRFRPQVGAEPGTHLQFPGVVPTFAFQRCEGVPGAPFVQVHQRQRAPPVKQITVQSSADPKPASSSPELTACRSVTNDSRSGGGGVAYQPGACPG